MIGYGGYRRALHERIRNSWVFKVEFTIPIGSANIDFSQQVWKKLARNCNRLQPGPICSSSSTEDSIYLRYSAKSTQSFTEEIWSCRGSDAYILGSTHSLMLEFR